MREINFYNLLPILSVVLLHIPDTLLGQYSHLRYSRTGSVVPASYEFIITHLRSYVGHLQEKPSNKGLPC